MDGNDSLKHVLRREPVSEDGEGQRQVGDSSERLDERVVGGDYYITCKGVERWAKLVAQDLLPSEPKNDEDEDNPCAEHWTNMINEVTAHMWGIFDETGIFLALCRHGFVLVVANMIQSGELYVHLIFSTFCMY